MKQKVARQLPSHISQFLRNNRKTNLKGGTLANSSMRKSGNWDHNQSGNSPIRGMQVMGQNPIDINMYDVLCGRSRFAFDHPGNIKLREVITSTLGKYNMCNRKGKTAIIRGIIQSILVRGGRFLKYNTQKGQWYDVGFEAARIRVSTAFRDARSCRKAKTPKTKNPKIDMEPLNAFPLHHQWSTVNASPVRYSDDEGFFASLEKDMGRVSLCKNKEESRESRVATSKIISLWRHNSREELKNFRDFQFPNATFQSSGYPSDHGSSSILLEAVDLIDIDSTSLSGYM